MEDLDVQLENNQLTIKGKQGEEDQKIYLHRGIATRQFQKTFVLADGIEVTNASLDNGLLHIDMKRIVPEPTVKKIEITNGGTKTSKKIGNISSTSEEG
jgi:HSP20 family molecular chaperone IbpA